MNVGDTVRIRTNPYPTMHWLKPGTRGRVIKVYDHKIPLYGIKPLDTVPAYDTQDGWPFYTQELEKIS